MRSTFRRLIPLLRLPTIRTINPLQRSSLSTSTQTHLIKTLRTFDIYGVSKEEMKLMETAGSHTDIMARAIERFRYYIALESYQSAPRDIIFDKLQKHPQHALILVNAFFNCIGNHIHVTATFADQLCERPGDAFAMSECLATIRFLGLSNSKTIKHLFDNYQHTHSLNFGLKILKKDDLYVYAQLLLDNISCASDLGLAISIIKKLPNGIEKHLNKLKENPAKAKTIADNLMFAHRSQLRVHFGMDEPHPYATPTP